MTVAFFNAWGILLKGGPMMGPIFLLSLLALTVGIEKLVFLNALDARIKKFKPVFFNCLREGRMKDALGICEENTPGLGPVCKAGLMKFGSTTDLIKAKMEEVAGFEIHALKGRMDFLGFIVNAAPLLGLLGTTTSLCVVFHAAQMRSNALTPLSLGDMASGVWQALLTTSAGLAVGIIGFAVYAFAASRINDVVTVYEETISETVRLLQAVSESDAKESHGSSTF